MELEHQRQYWLPRNYRSLFLNWRIKRRGSTEWESINNWDASHELDNWPASSMVDSSMETGL